MAKNSQEELGKLLDKRSKLLGEEKELRECLNDFASSSTQDYDCLQEIAADLSGVYARLGSINLELRELKSN